MSIHLNVSNDISVLAARLTARVGGQHRDPFQSEWIVTQTAGMNDWLKQRFATDLGIAANMRFCTPDDVVTQVRYWLQPAGKQPLDREVVRWAIFGLLGTADFRTAHPEKAAYFSDSDIRRISLADEMADLFDQYQIYRSDLLTEWRRRRVHGEAAVDWQEWLWARLQERFDTSHIDRVEAKRALREILLDPEARALVGRRMPILHVFGVAVITPYHLEMIYVLSEFIEVYLYLVNPAPGAYWLEDTTERQMAAKRRGGARTLPGAAQVTLGNELLINLGRLVRDSFSLLFQDQDMINLYDPEEAAPPAGDRLLHKIQRDIQHNRHGSDREEILSSDIEDGSLVLTGSFTPLREVEALYNHLVRLVDGTPGGISPRDILVQVTDIDLYAPYIKAVFGNARYRMPFSIADQSVTADNNMFTAVQALLAIDAEQMKAEEVLELLESPYIRTRFGITDTEDIRDAVRQAGIIYSLEGRQEDDTRYISWHHGLKRILYGLCIGGGVAFDDGREDLLPLDSAEGAAADERIRFIHFLNMLEQLMAERRAPRTIAGWAGYLRRLLEELVFEAGARDDEDHPHFISLLDEMSQLDQFLGEEVSFEVFRHSFLHRLVREQRTRAFLAQGITFCSMVPMRSIPFRVVAMLGMDYDKFPRRDSGVSFSYLVSGEPRPGDRNVRNNDRHLFLETLLSAREMLYISYCSRDEKDAALKPPSSLVDELIDYVAKGMVSQPDTEHLRNQWVLQHPLHGFNSAYFDGRHAALRNYLPESRFRTGIEVAEGAPRVQTFDLQDVDIDRLVAFMQNPPRTLLQRQFNVSYYDEELLLPEHEVFEVDSLQKHALRQDLLGMDPAVLTDYARRQQRTGKLPLHNMGTALAGHLLDEMAELRAAFSSACNGRSSEEVAIDLPLTEGRLIGRIPGVYGDEFIVVCTSSSHFKYVLAGYVRYLALLASGRSLSFVFITSKIEGLHRIDAGTITAAEAIMRLDRFVQYYRSGHAAYFRFHPNLAREDFEMLTADHESFTDQLESLMENDRIFDFNDEYLQKAIGHGFFSKDGFDELKSNVTEIMRPLAAYLPALFPVKKKKK
jgi:exodeoxyribonuclease V gamma subunit